MNPISTPSETYHLSCYTLRKIINFNNVFQYGTGFLVIRADVVLDGSHNCRTQTLCNSICVA